LHFKRPDVRTPASWLGPGSAALINYKRRAQIIDCPAWSGCVDCGAAREQRVGERRSAIVLQWSEERVLAGDVSSLWPSDEAIRHVPDKIVG
jgi:hypothetical protein